VVYDRPQWSRPETGRMTVHGPAAIRGVADAAMEPTGDRPDDDVPSRVSAAAGHTAMEPTGCLSFFDWL
jgi:hypothetical protein